MFNCFCLIIEFNRFFVTLTVYLIGGMLFMKYQKQASGTDLIPNKEIWISIPENIKVIFD